MRDNIIDLSLSDGVWGNSRLAKGDWREVVKIITTYQDLGVTSDAPEAEVKRIKNKGLLYLGGKMKQYGGTCTTELIENRQLIVLDYDKIPAGGMEPFLDCVDMMFEGYACLVHSTARHTLDTPKFRIVFPIDGVIAPGAYPAAVSMLASKMAGYELDPASKKVAQRMFTGQHFSDVEPEYEEFEGDWLTPDAFPTVAEPVAVERVAAPTTGLAGDIMNSRVGVTTALPRIQSYLEALSPSMGRAEWLQVCMGVHEGCSGSAEGLELFTQWSSGGENFDSAEDVAATWRSLKVGVLGGVTMGTVVAMSKAAGWRDEIGVAADNEDVQAVLEVLGKRSEYVDINVLAVILKYVRSKPGGFLFLVSKNLPTVSVADFNGTCDDRFGHLFTRRVFTEGFSDRLAELTEDYLALDEDARLAGFEQYTAECAELSKDVEKAAKAARESIFGTVRRYVVTHKQVGDLSCRVDMFAKRLSVTEDHHGVTSVVSPFSRFPEGSWSDAVVNDFKAHFPEFDQFLEFLAAARFADSRRNAYLWLHCDSSWGKGLLTERTGVLGAEGLGICCETSVKEIEAALEGKPVGLSVGDLVNAWMLTVDEFKTIRSEIKQLNDTLIASPKNQLRFAAPLYAKVFTSAESVDALVGDAGVETQFANRFSYIRGLGDINERVVFDTVGAATYKRELRAYCGERMNLMVETYRELGERGAEAKADSVLRAFHGEHKLSLKGDFEDLEVTLQSEADEFYELLQKLANGKGCSDSDAAPMFHKFCKHGSIASEEGVVLTRVNHVLKEWLHSRYSASEVGKVTMKTSKIVDILRKKSGFGAVHWLTINETGQGKTVKGLRVMRNLPV